MSKNVTVAEAFRQEDNEHAAAMHKALSRLVQQAMALGCPVEDLAQVSIRRSIGNKSRPTTYRALARVMVIASADVETPAL